MPQRKACTVSGPRTSPLVMAALIAAAGLPTSIVFAQPQGEAKQQATKQTGPAQPAERPKDNLKFNFKEAPIDQVLDFFARESGVPIIFEVAAPEGKVTFVSSSSYTFEDALSIFNLNLQRHGVHLRKEGQYLYLASLADSMKRPSVVANARNVNDIPPDTFVTVSIPLDNAKAEQVAEQIKTMVGQYGGVLAVPVQNMVIVVESAAQVRRIRDVVAAIDAVKPADSAFRLFPLKFAQADAVLGALKGLVGERTRTVVVDKDGRKTEIQDQAVQGLSLVADPRTNSIIAVGPAARIRTVEELIALLDVPGDGSNSDETQMTTFTLTAVTPEEAAKQVTALFASVDPKQKPIVLPLAGANKLTIVGGRAHIGRAMALLSELDSGVVSDRPDGSGVRHGLPIHRAATVKLAYASPAAVEVLLGRLLTQKQLQTVKFAAAPDSRSVVVSGLDADVTWLESLVRALDVAPDADKDVRIVRIAAGNPAAVLRKAQSLYQQTGRAEKDPVIATLDNDSRSLTLVGSSGGLAAFGQLLASAEEVSPIDMEVRRFVLGRSQPSVLAAKLSRLAKPLLTPSDGAAYVEPVFEPADDIATLIVRARPEQFQVLSGLVQQLDSQSAGGKELRVVRLGAADARSVLKRAQDLYATRTEGLPTDQAGPIDAELDEASGSVVFSGRAAGMRVFADALTQAQQLVPPVRTTRVVDIQNLPADRIIEPLQKFLESADSIDPSRRVPAPTVQVVERTNSLLVTAEEAQHRLVLDAVQRLDKLEPGDAPPLKLIQLRTADAAKMAAMLNEQYGKRPQVERSARPVEVRADEATNTLIVSAHPELFDQIKAFVEELNRDTKGAVARQTELFPLKVAKAVDVAAAMDRLYPEPPIPTDRAGRPQPWLRKAKEVNVSAEPNSNSLIIDAEPDRMESLRQLAEKLDRVEMPPAAQLKTYRITGPSLDAVAKTLNAMSSRGILTAPAQPGKPPVQVMIETEPRSSTLIVAGDDKTFETVEQVLKDLSLIPVEKGLRIVPIANEKATSVRERAMKIYEAQVAQIPGANPVEVSINEQSNTLMVVADGEAMTRFMKVLDELQRQAGPAREVRLIELKLAKAGDVVDFLRGMVESSESMMIRGGPAPVFETVDATNSIMVAAQPAQFAVIDSLVKGLDARQTADKPPMRILKLRSTDAANLAAVLQHAYDERPIEQRGKQPVSIAADAGTNTLIVSASTELLPEIEQIVSQLNEQTTDANGHEIRIFPLKVARAEELARTIDQMYPEPPIPLDPRTRQPRLDLKLPKEVTVRADHATNSLIVDAPSKRLAGFEQLVRSLDQQKLGDSVTLRTYKLERADLASVASTIEKLAGNGSFSGKPLTAPVTVSTEASTRTLIVSGPQEVFDSLEATLKTLDAAPQLPSTEMKIYPLTTARSERLQPLVERVLTQRARELQPELVRSGADAPRLVEVTSDGPSNTLIINAPRAILAVADGLVQTLDQQSVSSGVEVRVFRLGKGEAATVGPAIASAIKAQSVSGEPAATVTPEPGSNTIVVVGTAAQIEKAAKLIETMDTAADRDGLGVKTITLKHARAESLAPVLEGVLRRETALDKLPDWMRAQAIARGATDRPNVRVMADPVLNALVISGPLNIIEVAEQVAGELDMDPQDRGGERSVRVITLQNSDAAALAANLQAVFAEDVSAAPKPTIRVDTQSNSLIVRATPAQMTQVDELTRKLDDASVNSSRQMRMVSVDKSRVDAELLASTLKRLLEQQGGVKVEVISAEELLRQQGGGSSPASGVTPEKQAPKKIGAADDRGLRSPTLSGTLAARSPWSDVLVAAFFAVQQPEEPVAETGGVTIAVDKATNSIMIVGSPRLTDRLATLAAELQRQMPASPAGVHVVKLPTGADLQGISEMVRQTTAQIGRASPTSPGGFSGPVSVFPDPSGSALIVLANDIDFAVVGRLAASLAQVSPASPLTIKVYPLTSVSAERAISALHDLFSGSPNGRQAQRVRAMDISIPGPDGSITARIDAASVRMTADPSGASIIVSAPQEAFVLVDRLIETIDQNTVKDRLAIQRYDLKNARADDLSRTLQSLFDAQRQGPNAKDTPQARFVADDRTNSMLVTASGPQHADIARLLETADSSLEAGDSELAIITLQQALPSTVQRIVEEVVVGRDPARKSRVRISAQDGSSLFVVQAPKADLAQVRDIVAQVDSAETGGLPVRSIKLERADAGLVASALQKFFTERAQVSSRPGTRVTSRVAVVGDKRTGTLVVSSSDEDYAQVESLVKTFDTPTPAQDLQFKVVALKHARVTDIANTIKEVVDEMRWETMYSGRRQQGEGQDHQLYVQPSENTNSIVLVGRGEGIAAAERVIAALDLPQAERTATIMRSVVVKTADVQALRSALQKAFSTPGWGMWRGPDPEAITVEVDKSRRALIVLGKAERVEQAMGYIKELDAAPEADGIKIEAITLSHAKADRAGMSLRQFFADRARSMGVDAPPVNVIGSQDGNVLIVSGRDEDLRTLRDLVAQIDQPDGGKDRRIEVFVLKNGTARDTADALRSMFARSGKGDEQVIITPQPSTNSLLVSAPAASFDDVVALLKQLDAAPKGEEANIETVALTSAKAAEVAAALKSALPAAVKVTVTPVTRSNSLLLTGSKEAIALVMEHIRKLDTEPVRSGLIFRRFKIANADATEVSYTVEQMLRARPHNVNDAQASIDYSRQDNTLTVYAPSDQMEEIDKIVRELDTPVGEERTTEFIRLEFAKSEPTATALKNFYGRSAPEASTPGARNVTIISDPVSNSLVIRAEQGQWDGIRSLLAKLDTKEYDTARQLAVIPLAHADAPSVAKALNDGLRAPLEEELRLSRARAAAAQRAQGPNNNQRPFLPEPTILISPSDLPTVSAEPLTNAVIVFANKPDLQRIEDIVKQLDVAGFADMPLPRIIPLKNGKPSAVAASIRELYLNKQPNQKNSGPKAVVVIGDDTTGALLVRADDEQFAQIRALASTLEQQGELGRVTPHVVRLKNVAAARLRQTLLATFTETAKSQGETFAVEIDRSSNSLVIACSPRLLDEVQRVITELDGANLAPEDPEKPGMSALSQSVTIVDVTHNAPADIKKMLEDMGLTRPQTNDQRGVVSEPVTIVALSSRRALAVVASPADARAVEALVHALDSEPIDAQQQMAIVPLKMASARPLVETLLSMLRTSDPKSETLSGPAKALAEQVRRLSLAKNGINAIPATVDLAKPIRLIADVDSNAVVIASTQANIDALKDIVRLLDTLPVGDAVVVRIFMLENASATRVKTVIEQLFTQGEALRRLPGTRRQGLPTTATGQALAGEIAVSIDERTNAMVVAGREEAVALVEVLIKDLDSDRASKWIEPLIIPLKFADSATLSRELNAILVRGLALSPEAVGLQRQYGRLRMLGEGRNPTDKDAMVEADLFAAVNGLVIAPEEQLNSLIVVGTPANNQIVKQLVAMLDVEAASAANTVRVYPLQHAASERVVGVARDIFRQREQATDQRPEDRLIISSDARTNSIIASSSNKSLAILEGLLKTLDGEKSNFSVGLHVVPVTSGDVRQLAPRIGALMRERITAAAQVGGTRNPLDAFSIEPEPTNNLLIVAASDENLQVVKELVAALSADSDRQAKGERMDIVQLTRGRAAEVADSLATLYVAKEVAKRGAGSVSATANERLNAIVISGNEQDMIELRALAHKLDTTEVLAKQQVKWIELKSANAPEVVRLLQSVLAGRPLSGGQVRQATKIQFLRDKLTEVASEVAGQKSGRKPTEADIDGAIKDQVTLTADQRTNSIWITAPAPIVTLLSEMIEDIEASSAGARQIEYFKLQNADARQMAEVLRDTFNLRQQGNALVLVPLNNQQPEQPGDAPTPGLSGLEGSTVTAVPDERQQLSIAVDARTNTLIVSGTADYLDLVRKLVTELDDIEANERERRVYSLRNAKAKEIETTLKSYFQNETSAERTTLGPQLSGSLMRRLEEEVTVVGDEKSNKLVISTSPRYMSTVLSIIDELDAAPPQVMIQVLLAEVTLDNTETWGVDVNVGPFGGEGYRIGSTPAGSSVATALGVPNLAVSSADFGVLIRSLEEQGKLEVLSNPQVTVNNNQVAKIQVGENIAVVNGVERSSIGNSFADLTREDVGIILNVVPSISADGFVRMDIQPEISQLSAKTTQISADVFAPIIKKRAVDTVVTVKDGQSVVIGGLIQSSEEQRHTKVPILGDIPVLGYLFRTKKDTNVKTELLVILTARVIPGQAGIAEPLIQDVTEQAVDRLQDPSKVEDYLERLRLEIKHKKVKEAEAEAAAAQGRPLDPDAFVDPNDRTPTTVPAPTPSIPEPSVLVPSRNNTRTRIQDAAPAPQSSQPRSVPVGAKSRTPPR